MTALEAALGALATKYSPLPPNIDAVIDTNVLIDIFSVADLEREARETTADLDSDAFVYRRARLREALVLAWWLHDHQATTWGLHFEVTRQLTELAPPEETTQFGTHYTTRFVHFVRPKVLSSWTCLLGSIDETTRGSQNDDLLIEICRRANRPLISNEGFTTAGIVDGDRKKIRAKGRRAGVEVLTPGEFLRSRGANPRPAIRRFLGRFESQRARFLKGAGASAEAALTDMHSIYRHVFFGLTRDPTKRVRVTVQRT